MTAEQEDDLLNDMADYLDERGPGTPVGAEAVISENRNPKAIEDGLTESGSDAEMAPGTSKDEPKDPRKYVSPGGKEYVRQVRSP